MSDELQGKKKATREGSFFLLDHILFSVKQCTYQRFQLQFILFQAAFLACF